MSGRVVSIILWLVLSILAAVVVARARYTADLSAFLPDAPTRAQQLLVDQLREGPASRLILISIEGADGATRARLSQALVARLRGATAFRVITNGEPPALDQDQAFLFGHRYVLSDRITPERFAIGGLRSALQDGIDLLSSPMGLLAKDLFARDPTGEMLYVLSGVGGTTHPVSVDGVWVSRDEQRALLVAETRAAGSDTDGQQLAIEAIHRAFEDAQRADATSLRTPGMLRLTGPGVFAVEARALIKHEAIRLSVLSSLLITTFLLAVYRSVPALLLGLLPVATGALAGVAAVALGFGVVHGVTLGFGVTLIGEAVDYSVYLFLQARRGLADGSDTSHWVTDLWPTIRLGMLTSVCGFASLLPSGFPGLAQLGLYSIAGLVTAALVTRFVLPGLLPHELALDTAARAGRAFARAVARIRPLRLLLWAVPLLAGLCLYVARDRLWNHELSALSPVMLADQALDASLRSDLGAPDVRTLIVVSASDAEAALRGAEMVGVALELLVADGTIAGFESPSRYLPSRATQLARRDSLPPAGELQRRLVAAVASLPIRAGRLQPFVDDVEAARRGPLIQRSDLTGTSIASGVDALMIHRSNGWNVLLPLRAQSAGSHPFAIDAEHVTRALRTIAVPGVEVVVLDLKRESDALYSGYLSEAARLSLAGLGAILVLLLISLRSAARVVRVVAPLVLAVLVVMTGFALAGHAMTILHLIGMLLIVAIGSNYALFFDRASSDADPGDAARILASLLIANATTVIGFGVLASSTVPVLAALGSTVAPGALLALLFSAVLARDSPAIVPAG